MRLRYIISRLSHKALVMFGRNTKACLIRGEDYISGLYSPDFIYKTITWNEAIFIILKAAQFYYHKTVPI